MSPLNPVASIWPYKVVLPWEISMRSDVTAHVKLSTDLGLRRPQGARSDARWQGPSILLTSKKHAEDFYQRFGGQLIDNG